MFMQRHVKMYTTLSITTKQWIITSYKQVNNYGRILHRFRLTGKKYPNFLTPLYLASPLGLKLSDLSNNPW